MDDWGAVSKEVLRPQYWELVDKFPALHPAFVVNVERWCLLCWSAAIRSLMMMLIGDGVLYLRSFRNNGGKYMSIRCIRSIA